ncbi:hypothetical protein FRC03_009146 [Tulasnella sp. 419]|nr:hypothetical protein FRC03_009146 [Tulasnella sp. 419]
MSSPPKASPSPSPPASPTSALRPLGKVRSPSKTRVSFAADVLEHHDETAHTTDDEHTPLLNNKSPDGEEEGEESADHLTSLPSRLHRKLKRGLTIGRAKMRKPGQGLPMYRNGNLVDHHEEDDYMTTQRALLYCVLALIAIALVLGAFVLVQSTEHNPTGPYPHPPIHTKPHPTHVLPTGIPPPPFPSGMPRNPAFLVKGSNGAVATENKDCSTMGIDILKVCGFMLSILPEIKSQSQEGGNAVDAAIASTLCSKFSDPPRSSIAQESPLQLALSTCSHLALEGEVISGKAS